MAVEIQTVILCKRLGQVASGILDLQEASVYEVFPPLAYPIQDCLDFYVLLRKDARDLELPFDIQIRMIDADGRTLARPRVMTLSGTFPAGSRFWGMTGQLSLVLSGKGSYAVLFDVRSQGALSHFRYDLEAVDRPAGPDVPAVLPQIDLYLR